MVPNGWKVIKLNDISEKVTSGSRNWAQYYSDKGSKFIRMTNLQRESIYLNLDDLKFVDIETNSTDGKRTSLEFGDILMSITAELGKIGWVHEGLGESYINRHTALIRLNHEKAYSKYIAYLLSSKEMNHRINRLNDSGAKAGLNLPTIRSLPISIPPLPEQRKIAKILTTWDKAIDSTERLIENSTQQKKALMQQLLTGKKRLLDDNGKPFEGEWDEYTLEQAATYRRGSFPQPYGDPRWVDEVNGYPFVQVYDIDKNMKLKSETKIKISDAAIDKSVFIPKDTIVVSLQGSIGRVAITQYDAYVDRTILLFQEFLKPMNKVFFAYIIQELFDIEKTKAPGGTIKTITKAVLSNFRILTPSLEEQQKIAAVLTNADKEIELLEQQLADLQQEKKALMQQLLTGKVRVAVA